MKCWMMIALLFGVSAGTVQATHLEWIKSHSGEKSMLVLPPGALLDPYLSPAATGAFTIDTHCIQIQPGCGSNGISSQWHVSGKIPAWKEVKKAWDQALLTSTPTGLVLDSEGGNVAGGIFLMAQALKNNLRVEVPNGASCVSACVYVLTAGATRTVGPWALVGVHQQNHTKYMTPQDLIGLSSSQSAEQVGVGSRLEQQIAMIDEVSTSNQVADGYWVKVMVLRQVSPLLLMYTASAPQTYHVSSLRQLKQPCVQALGLDNSNPDVPSSSKDVLRVCGDVNFEL